MFTFKKHYYLYIENSKQIDITKIKIRNKFSVIYRNYIRKEDVKNLMKFRNLCRSKNINFFVSNCKKLSVLLMLMVFIFHLTTKKGSIITK